MFKRVFAVFMTVVLLCSMLVTSASARTYSTEYPNVFNSGSPVWFQCQVQGYGEYVVILDPNTNLQSFGFDNPTGYNLINNTGSTINGRAYSLTSSGGFIVRFPSYYCMQFREAGSTGVYSWEDVVITSISGTTLDLIDYHGDRGNDFYKYELDRPELIIVISLVIIIFVLVYQFHFKSRLMRM